MAEETFKQKWDELDPKFKIAMVGIGVVGVIVVGANAYRNSTKPVVEKVEPVQARPSGAGGADDLNAMKLRVLPQPNRNQGLEDVTSTLSRMEGQFAALRGEVADLKQKAAMTALQAQQPLQAAPPKLGPISAVELDRPLPGAAPPPVSFDAPSAQAPQVGKGTGEAPPAAPPSPPQMKIWESTSAADIEALSEKPNPVIPVNSGLEAVMLSGVNARPSGSIAGAVGSATSANSVGAPFITRIKGDAILPNGWKLADLGDCFLSGSAVAVLSTERAYAISDKLSCISEKGEVWEADIKAYALDVDGTLGLAGKVVSKQGSLLLQSALTGMASGLGAALTPTAVPSYNTNPSSGSTQSVQFPNPTTLATTAVSQGINQAASQLSKFYLEYAREIFPVVEVTAKTRVTWILKESVELKRMKKGATK